MPKKSHEIAFEIFKKSGGNILNDDIAKHLSVSSDTVRKWKSRYKWLKKLNSNSENTETKSVTKSKRVTKKKLNIREEQQTKILNALVEAGTYSPALDLLIDVYLDCYEEYHQVKRNGENGEKLRKELAKLLSQLGLDGKNKELIKKSGVLLAKGDQEKQKGEEVTEETNSELLQFRQRKMRL